LSFYFFKPRLYKIDDKLLLRLTSLQLDCSWILQDIARNLDASALLRIILAVTGSYSQFFYCMSPPRNIFIGTDSGATTSKIAGVWGNGEAITTKLLQRPTNSQNGTDAVIASWISAIGEFLAENQLAWSQVDGVGLAIPGPYQRYGVLDHS